MIKGISVPLPSKVSGFGKADSKSSKKRYKVESENIQPSVCLPYAPTSVKMYLLSGSATSCNTVEENCL